VLLEGKCSFWVDGKTMMVKSKKEAIGFDVARQPSKDTRLLEMSR